MKSHCEIVWKFAWNGRRCAGWWVVMARQPQPQKCSRHAISASRKQDGLAGAAAQAFVYLRQRKVLIYC